MLIRPYITAEHFVYARMLRYINAQPRRQFRTDTVQGPGACTFTGFLPVVSNVNVGISSEGVISINLLPL